MQTFNAANHSGNAGYDAAGNVSSFSDPIVGMLYYTYDAENRLVSVTGNRAATYAYDALGRRVKRVTGGTTYNDFYDADGHVTTNYNASSHAFQRLEMFGGGKHLVTYSGAADNKTYFVHPDWLGSEHARSDQAGAVCESSTMLPFGDHLVNVGTCDASPNHFTGKERDSETGLDYFGARYYASNMGRWMSPDWSAKAEPVPYSKLDDPQTLNLYGYVGNNPLSRADRDGHCAEAISCALEFGGGGSFFGPVGTTVGVVVGAGVGLYVEYRIAKWAVSRSQNSNANAPANAQTNTQSQSTPADPNNKKDGGAKKTEHGEQRANEAREGDAHRDVGDVNRTINEGKQYTDSDTGNNVYVRGNRVVITNEQGEVETQMKNTRANTQQRIEDGKWVPKPKPE